MGVYESLTDASKTVGVTPSHIGKVCNGIYDFCGNRVFSYKQLPKEYFNRKFESKAKLRRYILQKDLNGNLINTFKSLSSASESCGVNKAYISHCCNGIYNKAKGYIFEYGDLI